MAANNTTTKGNTMATYWRIQPAGLGLNHFSEDSNGEAKSLHVFSSVQDLVHCYDGSSRHWLEKAYGNEIVKIEGKQSWSNCDVEGVAINPKYAVIVGRFSIDEFCKELLDSVGVEYDEEFDDLWAMARDRDYDDDELTGIFSRDE